MCFVHAEFDRRCGQVSFPERPIIVVTESLRSQEVFQQDLQTWCRSLPGEGRKPLFYPAWEVLPHEARLPHVDVISERLETLVALRAGKNPTANLVVTSVTALLEKTLRADELERRTRRLRKGDRTDLTLPEADLQLLRVAKATGARVVHVILSGRPLILGEALTLADATVGPVMGADSKFAVVHAPSRAEAIALLLVSPEFLRR